MAPSTVTDLVTQSIEYILDLECVAPSDNLADLGMDEIDIMDLVIEMEEKLNIDVSISDEETLDDESATVQTAIDLFTKLSQ